MWFNVVKSSLEKVDEYLSSRESNYVRYFSLTLVVLLSVSCATTLPFPNTPEATREFVKTEIDKHLKFYQSQSQAGGSISVIKDDQVVYNRSVGLANIPGNEKVTEKTLFRIASLAKPITALSLMQLVERKIISLEDSVCVWLPELPQTWCEITVHNLLTHQSGIQNYFSSFTSAELDEMTNQDVIQYFLNNNELDFSPGLETVYRNENYILLAEIIRSASGLNYNQYVHENILDPLGMSASFIVGEEIPAGNSIALNNGSDPLINGVNYLVVGPIGLLSSISDLKIFVRALLSNQIVSAQTFEIMTHPYSKFPENSKFKGYYYGYGWLVRPSLEGVLLHGGTLNDFRAMLYINQKESLEYIALGNGGQDFLVAYDNSLAAVKFVYENVTLEKMQNSIRIEQLRTPND